MTKKIRIEISARHIHLSKKHVKILFGKEWKLTKKLEISQPNQFIAKERITLIGPKQKFSDVAIIGPERRETQVEISKTDAYFLGIPKTPLCLSGDLQKSGGNIILKGPCGSVKLKRGVIVAQRHLHISPQQAAKLALKNNALISIQTVGERSVIFHNVVVRFRAGGADQMSFHLDTDEGNAAGVKTSDKGNVSAK